MEPRSRDVVNVHEGAIAAKLARPARVRYARRMNQACVSLEEVLTAANVRAASLVPETSGYLTLAVADATSKLPYAIEDRGVLLTVDGSVMVPRKPALTAPPEAGRGLRDLLRRLLATSTGTMPGLASAARARGEEIDVEHVVGDVEAALIPVNRTAAKRALARLARETLRAKEAGKLRKKSVAPPAEKTRVAVVEKAVPVVEKVAVAVAEKAAPGPENVAATVVGKAVLLAENVAVAMAEEAPPPVAGKALPVVEEALPLVEAVAAPVVAEAPKMVAIAPPAVVVAPPPAPLAEAVAVARIVDLPPAPPPMVMAPPPAIVAELARIEHEVEVVMSPDPGAVAAADDGPIAWEGEDATIADPAAIAVIEAQYREIDEDSQRLGPDDPTWVPGDVAPRPVELPREEDSFTQPWGGKPAVVVAPQPVIEAPQPSMVAAPQPAIEAPKPSVVVAPQPAIEAPKAAIEAEAKVIVTAPRAKDSAPQAEPAILAQLSGSRADELIGAFRAEDEGDPAVLAAASSLRAFAGVDEPASKRAPQRPSYLRPPEVARKAPSIPDLDDEDLLPLPPPRSAKQAGSRWPFALFALGVLALFAAWIYRPTLAKDFFGLQRLISPAATPPPAAAPASSDDAAPSEDTAPPAANRPRDTHAAAGSGDGARRRRD